SGRIAKEDYEYVRRGTRNIFMAIEPLGGYRETAVTVRLTKTDFVHFVCGLLDGAYRHVTKLHLVLYNLEEVLGEKEAAVLQRIDLLHTPKHASWLNVAELELAARRTWKINLEGIRRSLAAAHRPSLTGC